jgi:hypothetical protein
LALLCFADSICTIPAPAVHNLPLLVKATIFWAGFKTDDSSTIFAINIPQPIEEQFLSSTKLQALLTDQSHLVGKWCESRPVSLTHYNQ